MTFRCESHRLIPRAAIERFQEWVYHTDHPIEALLLENYFLPVGDRLLAGDVIEAYAVGLTCAQYLRFLVAGSGRKAVIVVPFSRSHDVDGACIQSASMLSDRSARQGSRDRYELRHLRHGDYRIVDRSGDVVVGGIRGYELGVDVLGKVLGGKISVMDARRVVEKANLDAFQQDSQKGE